MNDFNSLAYWKKVDELKVKMDKDPQLMQKCKDDPAAFIKEHGIDAEIKINEKGDKKLLSEYLIENKTDLLKDITVIGKMPGDNLIVIVVANVVAFANAVANANAAVNANAVANANAAVNTNTFGKPVYPESTTRTVSRTVVSGDPFSDAKAHTQVSGTEANSTVKSQVTSNVKTHADIMSDVKVKTSVSGNGPKATVSGTEVATVAVDALVTGQAKSSVYVCSNSSVNSDGFAVAIANAAAVANAIVVANVLVTPNVSGHPISPEVSIASEVRTTTDGDGPDIVERPNPDLRVKTLAAGLDVRPIRPIKPIETKPIKPIRPRPIKPIATIEKEDAKKYLIGEYEVTYEMSDEAYEIFKKELDSQNLSKERQQAIIKRAVTNPDRVLDAKVFKREDGTIKEYKELKQAEIKKEVRFGDKVVTEKLSKEIAEMLEAKKYSLDETVEYQYKDKRFRIHITVSGKHVTINNVEVTDNE